MNKSLVINLTLVIVALGILSLACHRTSEQQPSPEQIQKQAAESAKRAELTKIPDKKQLVKVPFLKGKAVYFEEMLGQWSKENDFSGTQEGRNKIRDRLTYDLDKAETVILKQECTQTKAGSYGSADGYIEKCTILLIDPKIPAVVYEKPFEGQLDALTTVKSGETRIVGKVKNEQIFDFIADLPEK